MSVKPGQDRQVVGGPLFVAPRFACNGCLQLKGPAASARRRSGRPARPVPQLKRGRYTLGQPLGR